jgi:Mn2+/Fe2+ NRAMP family transporter
VRGLIIPVTLSYKHIENYIGSIYSALLIGMVCLLLAYIGLFHAEETFGKELDYEEVG